MRATRLLFLRQIRRHPLRSAISVVAVAAGVSMVLSIVIVVASIEQSFERQAQALAGPAPLRVVGPVARAGLDEDLVGVVQGTDGVAAAVPSVQAITLLERRGPSGGGGGAGSALDLEVVVLGLDCLAAGALVPGGCEQLEQGVVVGPSLGAAVEDAASEGVELAMWAARGSVDLSDAIVAPELAEVGGGTVAALPLARAQELYDREGSLDVIYVIPDEGVAPDALRDRLGGVVGEQNAVLLADEPPAFFRQMTAMIVPLFGLLALFALGIGLVLVANTVALSLEERRRELAVVAAIGATDRTLLGGALAHAAVLGVAGGVLGAFGGLALAYPITGSLSDLTRRIAGFDIAVDAAATPHLLAAAAGAAVAVLASWRAVRRALRVDVAAEISGRDRRLETGTRSIAIRALAVLNIGIMGIALAHLGSREGALEAWQPPLAMLGLLAATVGLAIGAGAVTPLLLRGLLALRVPLPGWAQLGMSNLVREPGRTGVMAVAVGAAVGTAFIAASFTAASERSIYEGITGGLSEQVLVSVGPTNNTVSLDSQLPADAVRTMGEHADVAAADRSAALLVGNDDVVGVVGWEGWGQAFEVYAGTADRDRFEAGEVIIGAGLARRERVGPGDMLRLPARSGMTDVPVQGVWADGDFSGNAVSMPLWLLEDLYGAQAPKRLSLTPADGVTAEELVTSLRAGGVDLPVNLLTAEELAASISDAVAEQITPFWAVQRGLTLVAFVAVLSTLLLVGIQRRRELGVLAAVGMEPGPMRRMVLGEAAAVGIVGVALAGVGSIGMFEAFRQVTPLMVGWPTPFVLAWWALPVYGAVTIAVVVAAAAVPAWRSARVPVVEALAYE